MIEIYYTQCIKLQNTGLNMFTGSMNILFSQRYMMYKV